MIVFWVLLPVAAFTSFALTGFIWRHAVKHQYFDLPNARSSHTEATPSGGGIAIAATFLGCVGLLFLAGLVSGPILLVFGGAGGVLAMVGFIDDRQDVPIGPRMLVHAAAAAWALYCLDGVPAFSVLGYELSPSWILDVCAAVFIVWLLNLYNFMDGIDGLASVEAITVCVAAAAIYLLSVPESNSWIVPAILSASVAGFLIWNYPLARIFMGDAGSGFIGFSLGVLAIQAAWEQSQLFWSWLILLGVFIVDASLTLLRRLLRSDRIYTAHRSHAYQQASRRFDSHQTVTNAVGAINLIWLFPWALAVANGTIDGVIGLLSAYTPLLGLAIHFKAGIRDD